MAEIEAVLLDVDGVLVTSWRPIEGAAEVVSELRRRSLPFRLVTNTTQKGRAGLADLLRAGGLDVAPDEVITASVATGDYLRRHFPGAKVFLLGDEDSKADLQGVEFVDSGADVVVVGDAEEAFTYENLNLVFRMLMAGARFVAMQRNMFWRTDEGLSLDAGAFVAALEEAAGVKATVIGKPSPEFFLSAIASLGVSADRVLMVGDDVANDVQAAQAVGCRGVLVRTGKFRPADVERLEMPATVIDSIADLPGLLE